jgi:hypothetical protein
MRKEASRNNLIRAIYFSLTFHIVICTIYGVVLWDIIDRSNGYYKNVWILALATLVLLLILIYWYNRYIKSQVLRDYGLFGIQMVAPTLLFIFSIPATVYFLVGGPWITVSDWSLLIIVTVSMVAYLSTFSVFTLTGDHILIRGFSNHSKPTNPVRKHIITMAYGLCAAYLLLILAKFLRAEFNFPSSFFYVLLPFMSLLIVIFARAEVKRLHEHIRVSISDFSPGIKEDMTVAEDSATRERSMLYNNLVFKKHYPYFIDGNTDYLRYEADDIFASVVINYAARRFDLALIPALNIIANTPVYSESIKHEAAGVIYNIEKYYSNPGKYIDMIVQEGVSEKAAAARKILISQRIPHASEVIRLLREPSSELKCIGLAAIGKFRMMELLSEVVKALAVPETEKEAFYLLNFFGQDIINEVSASFISTRDNESVSLLKIRLLTSVCMPDQVNTLADSIWDGAVRMKGIGVKYLKAANFTPENESKEKYTGYLLNILGNITRILSLEYAAKQRKCFGLSSSLHNQLQVNVSFAFDLLSFIIGEKPSLYLKEHINTGTWIDRKYATEVVNIAIDEPVRGPVLSLIEDNHPEKTLKKLQFYFPYKQPTDSSLVSLILNSDQNIAGTWVKACALRKVSERRLEADTDLLISYLFSSQQILQEEATRAIREINPALFEKVEHRLPSQTVQLIKGVVSNKIDDVSLVYEKTRFLALCFGTIPEERLFNLAKKVRFSESNDSQYLPGVITWIIPIAGGKSGIYSLGLGDISDFVFHNPEFIDVLIVDLEKAMSDNIENKSRRL